jgi:hypothetical protein
MKIILPLLLTLLLLNCSDDSIVYTDKPISQYNGVSSWDEKGKKVDEVDNDWTPECYEIAGFGDNHCCFYSIYPLPATDTLNIRIGSIINGEYKIWLAINDSTRVEEIFNDYLQEGDFTLQIPFTDNLYRDVVYRLFVESKDTSNNQTQIHFGDVIWK